MYPRHSSLLFILIFLFFSPCFSQKAASKKYPSLLWEITGNGLKKPSYLFGTMHVSSKMVFNLPDTFYYAIKNVDEVALELNPDVWQGQMVNLDQLEHNYKNFIQPANSDYLNERSFRLQSYEDELKTALSSEPTVVNGLLYRTYKSREDFEEDTFLDLYIFQTGKKLGKRTTGVENYYETEKIVLEAYADMAKEKKQRPVDTDGESAEDIEQKTEDAYRSGNLDLLDSLDNMMQNSDAFQEKFLYRRNDIQANSIDTILKKNSLFVGVGAAHLAGRRGVIELLRAKGYILRPVLMSEHTGTQKEQVDKMVVPVQFTTNTADDKMFSVDMPGPLYKMASDLSGLDRWQYADMSNGAYYLVTRVRTHAAFMGYSDQQMLQKVDSLLYENIPGKIINRSLITKNGYSGFDITNKTRRGDIQRYQIFITPFEVLVFKMSGNENYAEGAEGQRFFSSIQLREPENRWTDFEPKQGGFAVKMPQLPDAFLNTTSDDAITGWEYEAVDRSTKNSFFIFKKSVNNFRFLEEDTFDLGLIEESFRSSALIQKQLQRSVSVFKGYPSLDALYRLKDSGFVRIKCVIRGPDYYLLAAKGEDVNEEFKDFFNSFRFTPYHYSTEKEFTDTFLHYTVSTPVIPVLEENFRALIERSGQPGMDTYWPKTRNALFKSDSTGEIISVAMQRFPKYFYVKDSATFWKDEVKDYLSRTDFLLWRKDSFRIGKNSMAFKLVLRDTNSSRQITRLLILKGDRLYRIISMGDTLHAESVFVKDFYASFHPDDIEQEHNIFAAGINGFLADLYSSDSATHAAAQAAISNVYYRKNDIDKILAAINSTKRGGRNYLDTKVRFIAELGYINDTSANKAIVNTLKNIYSKASDTSMLQNAVVKALARKKSKEAYAVLKNILLSDPPVFENSYDYTSFFNDIGDSLLLARQLFPEILQLSTIGDYRDNITSLLVTLVDSNLLKAKTYEGYYKKIYFDAQIELKKQQIKDERKTDRKEDTFTSSGFFNYRFSEAKTGLNDYAVLMMPFYDEKPELKNFFSRLLYSKDSLVQLNTAVVMLRNNRFVPDSILVSMASDDALRIRLYKALEKNKLLNKFPATYKNQVDIARAVLVAERNYERPDSIVYLSNRVITFRNTTGRVYFFKYRDRAEDEWKIGISGLQPLNINEVKSNNKVVKITDKRIKADEPLNDQLEAQLKKLLFSLSKSGKIFYGNPGTRMNDF